MVIYKPYFMPFKVYGKLKTIHLTQIYGTKVPGKLKPDLMPI